MKIKIIPIGLLLVLYSSAYAQDKQFNYKRELKGVHDLWHNINLPDEIYKKVKPDLSDIRIIGITNNNDTIEAPYILEVAAKKTLAKNVAFTLINQSKKGSEYFYTFEIMDTLPVNEITLEFKQANFDWRLYLEGSHDQHEWFSILDNYRILSIKNALTNFKFTTVSLPSAKYKYYRLHFSSDQQPELAAAAIALNTAYEGKYKNYTITAFNVTEERPAKMTKINIELRTQVPVSSLQLFVKDTFDYYRPVTVTYLTDSFKTENGWKHIYSPLEESMLNSIDRNALKFNSTILQKLHIEIDNQDNAPLHFGPAIVQGYVHTLTTRFAEKGRYYLLYGNTQASKPRYDIERFRDKIPAAVTTLTLGKEQSIKAANAAGVQPLFQNKLWLWLILAIIIVMLGWFTLSMMKKKE